MRVPKVGRKKTPPPLDTGTGENVPKNTWLSVMEPNIKKFEVAAFTGGQAVWNAQGSKAMANLLRKMCDIIDTEIDRRAENDKQAPRQGRKAERGDGAPDEGGKE